MRRLCTALVLLAGLSLLGACETVPDGNDAFFVYKPPTPKPGSKEAEIETLQKATSLAQGSLAWEIVQISNIQHDAKSVKWVARTRSLNLRCTADPDGSNSYCELQLPG
ncbi:MAG TPA: hypothetical protein VL358_14640 [Caulobacteraceae bacterium]|jgi:hypothetical protein|nr:hypothetical protein [Caulobacteraceae bacterium]